MEEDRRREDAKLDAILKAQTEHLEVFHAGLKPGEAQRMVEEHNEMMMILARLDKTVQENANMWNDRGAKIQLLVEAISGKAVYDPISGEMTGRERGIAAKVEALEKKNGDTRISFKDKTVIAGILALITTIIQVVGRLA